MRDLATIYPTNLPQSTQSTQDIPLKSKLSETFQRFNAIDRSIEMKLQLKLKVIKHFASPKQRAALRTLFSLPYPTLLQIKPSGTKIFLRR